MTAPQHPALTASGTKLGILRRVVAGLMWTVLMAAAVLMIEMDGAARALHDSMPGWWLPLACLCLLLSSVAFMFMILVDD